MGNGSGLTRLVSSLITIPTTIVVILFAISNRGTVEVRLWPLPAEVDTPIYVLALVTLALGVLFGGVVAWLSGGAQRRRLRQAERRAARLETELSQTKSELKAARQTTDAGTNTVTNTGATPALPAPAKNMTRLAS